MYPDIVVVVNQDQICPRRCCNDMRPKRENPGGFGGVDGAGIDDAIPRSAQLQLLDDHKVEEVTKTNQVNPIHRNKLKKASNERQMPQANELSEIEGNKLTVSQLRRQRH